MKGGVFTNSISSKCMVCPAKLRRKHQNGAIADSSIERPPSISIDNYVASPIHVNNNDLRPISVYEDEIHIAASNHKRNIPKAIVEPITQTNPAMKSKSILEKEQDKMNQGSNSGITKPSQSQKPKLKPPVMSTARPSDNDEKEEVIYANEVTLVNNPIKLDDLADHVNKMKTQKDSFKHEYEVNIIVIKVKHS